MRKSVEKRTVRDLALMLLIQGTALGLSMVLARVDNDNNPFAMAVFILAVAVTARATEGYRWGMIASLFGTFCVNYFFSYPFWSFDITYPGYPLTMTVMLIVSLLISTLTTQIKKQEQLRFEMEREKLHANLLRGIAHDIRTPLASILGASSLLQEQRLPPEEQQLMLSNISQDARWLVRVTENLLSITRFSGGEVVLRKQEEVLEEITGSAVLKYKTTPGALPVYVKTPEDIVLICVDAVLMEQVLINLFDNVSAHAKGATGIWLTAEEKGERVVISVEDDGPGIPESILPHILEGTFQGMDRKRPDDRRNMGIGLSVCGSIIQIHGGKLQAGKSNRGGAKLTFDLPAREEKYNDESASENTDY